MRAEHTTVRCAMAREAGTASVVAPMHDEEEHRGPVHRAGGRGARRHRRSSSWSPTTAPRTAPRAVLAELAAADERVKVVTLSRNFGHQAALTAGLEHARGDAVVMIDADLQDPPEVIPEMVDRWREGIDVVYAVRQQRQGETAVQAHDRALVLQAVPPAHPASTSRVESGDFRLMDRRALDALLAMPERNRFLRGMTRVGRLHADRGAVPARGAHDRADQVHAAADAALLASTRSRASRTAPLQCATLLGFVVSAARLPGDPADHRRPLHEHLRARRPVDHRRRACCWAGSS